MGHMAVAPGTTVLRVLTWNVLAPDFAEWPERRKAIRAELRRLRPDVIALQEVRDGECEDQIADLLGGGFHLARHPRAPDGTTAVLGSRWAFDAVHEVDLDVTPRAVEFPWSGTVVAEVSAPAPIGRLRIVHHKPVYQLGHERERELQAVRTAEFVEGLIGASGRPTHTVLLGDLDAAPDAATVRFWTGRQSLASTSVGYHDAWESARPDEPGHTFTPDNPLVRDGEMPLVRPRRIDYVMVRGNSFGPTLRVVSCDLVGTGPTPPSDHYGVVADLTPASRPPGTPSTSFRR